MREIALLNKLFKLHEARKTMIYNSVGHVDSVKQAIELSRQLYVLTGRRYWQYSYDEVINAVAEAELLT